jgi:type II secretory pathway pseudopilin PulG
VKPKLNFAGQEVTGLARRCRSAAVSSSTSCSALAADQFVSISEIRVRPSHFARAFSLIEIMVAVSLMSFIVLGLLIMFNQTQKAFRTSLTQTDFLETGRIQMDMMVRELSQVSAAGNRFTTNIFAELSPVFNTPFFQGLPGSSGPVENRRTNIIQKIFFLSQYNQDWIGTGYQVIPDYANAGVGTLYRFRVSHGRNAATNMSLEFLNAPLGGLTRISDGVVHLRLRAFATNGYPIYWNGLTTNGVFRTNAFDTGALRIKNTVAYNKLRAVPDLVDFYFMSNSLPAFLELEVGILEEPVFKRFKAIGNMNPAAQQRYLSNHVGQVHIFRQRIPVRTVDFSAYQ